MISIYIFISTYTYVMICFYDSLKSESKKCRAKCLWVDMQLRYLCIRFCRQIRTQA